MTCRHHLPSRREALLGSGALFAWSQMPRLARAEGRDPRMLVIVLRGALDGLGAVAPVGDPDWIGLRGDRALLLDGKTAGAAARRLLRAQSGDAEPASALQGAAGDHRARHRDALSRALAFRRPGRAGERPRAAGRRRYRLAQPRAAALASGGRVDPRGSAPWRRPGDAAGGARQGAGDVVGAAAAAAGERGHAGPPARSLSAHRSEAGGRARGADPPCRARRAGGIGRSHGRRRRACRRPASRACAPISRKPPAPRRAFWPGRTARASARSASSAGTPTSTRARPRGSSPTCSARSTARWRRSRPTWATPGARRWSPSSPSSAAPRTSTAPTAPITAPARSRLLAGGALKGGRVIADWPGLKPAHLYEERDLKPTTDLRAVLKGLLRDHLRVDERALASTVFPDSADVAPIAGLVG